MVGLDHHLSAVTGDVPERVVKQIGLPLEVVEEKDDRLGSSLLHRIDQIRQLLLDPLHQFDWYLSHRLNLTAQVGLCKEAF